ncbi:hypothetical protein KBW71_00560 [Hydrogenophaga aromaticivorans]|uniref:hypothetical protein n=1 Tax=Hydrogenophaga aromaticivorans TaxID=2610898 RepID=UPI001B37660B|nr:hypothetical protein [Hydrogenophaga aromaticivorans]MBQ0916942.1 hypothetical protein [Hydrogenophaga aromaticivorans]MBU4337902.1 hypothetical protein [Actinomycetota bacterium]
MPYHLPTISLERAQKAMERGAALTPIPTTFYSGGETYTHTIRTARGTEYRVCKRVAKWLLREEEAGLIDHAQQNPQDHTEVDDHPVEPAPGQ